MTRKYEDRNDSIAYTEPGEDGSWCRLSRRNGKVWVDAFCEPGLSPRQCREVADRLRDWADAIEENRSGA